MTNDPVKGRLKCGESNRVRGERKGQAKSFGNEEWFFYLAWVSKASIYFSMRLECKRQGELPLGYPSTQSGPFGD